MKPKTVTYYLRLPRQSPKAKLSVPDMQPFENYNSNLLSMSVQTQPQKLSGRIIAYPFCLSRHNPKLSVQT